MPRVTGQAFDDVRSLLFRHFIGLEDAADFSFFFLGISTISRSSRRRSSS